MSVKLTTSLSQRLVLTPQLRQRIEMLQMTSLELSDLIQQQLLENPILEEVQTQDERREIEKEILDQLAGGPADDAAAFEAAAPDSANGNAPSANGAGDSQPVELVAAPENFEGDETPRAEEFAEDGEHTEQTRDSFDEIDFGREFQDYLDPGYKTQEFEYKEDAPTFEQFLTRPPRRRAQGAGGAGAPARHEPRPRRLWRARRARVPAHAARRRRRGVPARGRGLHGRAPHRRTPARGASAAQAPEPRQAAGR